MYEQHEISGEDESSTGYEHQGALRNWVKIGKKGRKAKKMKKKLQKRLKRLEREYAEFYDVQYKLRQKPAWWEQTLVACAPKAVELLAALVTGRPQSMHPRYHLPVDEQPILALPEGKRNR